MYNKLINNVIKWFLPNIPPIAQPILQGKTNGCKLRLFCD